MLHVFVLFREKIRKIYIAGNVSDNDCAVLDGFPYCVFSDLHMSESFGGHVTGPKDAGVVIVVYDCC